MSRHRDDLTRLRYRCSWCDAAIDVDPRSLGPAFCACGHRGDAPRWMCTCRVCLPELDAQEKAAMNALPADFIERILRGERPLGRRAT